MQNGSHFIDKAELAKRAIDARAAKGLTQMSVAHELGVSQKWVSMVELQQLSLHEDNALKIRELSKALDFQVPYIRPAVSDTPAPEAPKAPLSLPAKPVAAPVSADNETDVIAACAAELGKLGDQKACQRVLKYLSARFVWLDEPLKPHQS